MWKCTASSNDDDGGSSSCSGGLRQLKLGVEETSRGFEGALSSMQELEVIQLEIEMTMLTMRKMTSIMMKMMPTMV